MKTNYMLTVALATLITSGCAAQGILAQWNYNGPSATEVPGSADSPLLAVGIGDDFLVGGTTATFASGNTTAGTLETETMTPPNYGWNTTAYAAPGTENKMRGVQFNVNTVDHAGISFKFEQRLSNKAGNTYVVQYTTNRVAEPTVWIDAQTFTITPAETGTGDTWYNDLSVDLSEVTGLDDNALAAFRIVAAFDPGTGDYLAARSTSVYDGLGTVRYDMVTVTSNISLAATEFAGERTFSMSPNPADGGIVQFSRFIDAEVYDATGKLLLKISADSLDATSFTPGVYMIRTSSGGLQKLVIR